MTVWFLSMVSCSFARAVILVNKPSFVIPKRPGSVDHSGSHSAIAPHEWMSWEKRWWWKRVLSEDTVNGRRQRGDRLKCGASEQQQRDKEEQTTEEWTSIYAVRSRESPCLCELDFEIYSKKGESELQCHTSNLCAYINAAFICYQNDHKYKSHRSVIWKPY